jgi:hypothetical protein
MIPTIPGMFSPSLLERWSRRPFPVIQLGLRSRQLELTPALVSNSFGNFSTELNAACQNITPCRCLACLASPTPYFDRNENYVLRGRDPRNYSSGGCATCAACCLSLGDSFQNRLNFLSRSLSPAGRAAFHPRCTPNCNASLPFSVRGTK